MEHTPTPLEKLRNLLADIELKNEDRGAIKLIVVDAVIKGYEDGMAACADEIQALQDRVKELEVKRQWISVKDSLPEPNDEYYQVAVKNKNKDNGIFLYDIAQFSSDGIWCKSNTWEDVTHWAEINKIPYK
jgi:hypothetical protein